MIYELWSPADSGVGYVGCLYKHTVWGDALTIYNTGLQHNYDMMAMNAQGTLHNNHPYSWL